MNSTLWLAVSVIAVSGLCDTITHVGFKRAADRNSVDVEGVLSALRFAYQYFRSPMAWVGLVFSVVSLGLFLYALTMSDLSFAYSVDSVHHVFIALASCFYLKENISPVRWFGTLCIVAGIVLVTLSGLS